MVIELTPGIIRPFSEIEQMGCLTFDVPQPYSSSHSDK